MAALANTVLSALDALDAAAPVVWAPTGLDRLHVATGTVWRWNNDGSWVFVVDATSMRIFVTRQGTRRGPIGWTWWYDTETSENVTGDAPSESSAMAAALDAAGVKR